MKTNRAATLCHPAPPGSSPPRVAGDRYCPTAGAFLLECLIYLGMIMIVVGLLYGAFYRVFAYSTRLNRASGQIIQSLQVGERWRLDVRSTTGPIQPNAPEGAPGLRLPQAAGEVAYAFRDQTIWRRSGTNHNWQPILKNVKSARFEPVARSRVQAWRWELELNVTNRPARLHPLFTFQAVPGFKPTP